MSECRSGSSNSDVPSDDADSPSGREQTPLKTPKHHNNNFKAGYIPVCDYFHPRYENPTYRRRQTFAFWTLMVAISLLTLGNFLLTISIFGVLKLGNGMQSIELHGEDESINFFGKTDLGNLYKRDGIIEGFRDEPVSIVAVEGTIHLSLLNKAGKPARMLVLHKNGTILKGFDSFMVKNTEGELIYSTNNPHFKSLRGANSLNAKMVEANRIASSVDRKLKFESKIINLKGAEGTNIDAKQVTWSADQDLHLHSMNGSVLISGQEGIFIDTNKLPKALLKTTNFVSTQFKLCICMPQGKLFKVPVRTSDSKVYCDHINMSNEYNPCM